MREKIKKRIADYKLKVETIKEKLILSGNLSDAELGQLVGERDAYGEFIIDLQLILDEMEAVCRVRREKLEYE